MSFGDTTITVAGNLTADPDLRYTQTGVPVASFTVAASRRTYDAESGQWQDGETLFLRCSAWRYLAEHIAESLAKGQGVIVTGRLRQREYETTEGEKRTVYEVDAEDAGPSLRFATAKPVKATRGQAPHPADMDDDRWASPPQPATAGASARAPAGDEPPF